MSKVIETVDITPNPWAILILAGRYKEAEAMKKSYMERNKK